MRNARVPTVLLILALAAASCGSPEPRLQETQTVQGLRTETARLQTIADEIEAPGTVMAASTAQLAARTTGSVTQVSAREGDAVKRGQLLAQIDDAELQARRDSTQAALQMASTQITEATRAIAMAQAQADVARKTYDRYVYLRDQKSVSAQEFDEVEARQLAAQAGLEQARARLQLAEAGESRAQSEARAAEEIAGYARIVAPFDGRVSRRMVERGSLVTPGLPLFIVEDTSRYQLEITVSSDALTQGASAGFGRRGSTAQIQLDALPEITLSGRVAEVEAGADPASHTVRARIDLPSHPALRSGLFGRARLPRGDRRALVVPSSAVTERGQLRGVYVTDLNGIARWRVVTLGQAIGDGVEVLSGLSEGEPLVVDPGHQDLDGKKLVANSGPEESAP